MENKWGAIFLIVLVLCFLGDGALKTYEKTHTCKCAETSKVVYQPLDDV